MSSYQFYTQTFCVKDNLQSLFWWRQKNIEKKNVCKTGELLERRLIIITVATYCLKWRFLCHEASPWTDGVSLGAVLGQRRQMAVFDADGGWQQPWVARGVLSSAQSLWQAACVTEAFLMGVKELPSDQLYHRWVGARSPQKMPQRQSLSPKGSLSTQCVNVKVDTVILTTNIVVKKCLPDVF